MMRPHTLAACAGLLLVLTAQPICADTVFIAADGTGDFPDIQSAVYAVPDGSIIYLLPGLYSGRGNCGVVLDGKNVSLMVFGSEASAILDCQGTDRALKVRAGVDSTSVIRGLLFRNGSAEGSSGGAIDCFGGGPKIQNCTFTDNSATYGGAIRSYGEPAPIIEGCIFERNTAVYGGALDAREVAISVRSCTFGGNTASRGGAMNFLDCAPTIRNCTVCMNSAALGAAIRLDGSVAKIEKCIVAFNLTNEAILGEESSETSYSCVFGNADGDAIDGNAHHNAVVDPMLCDVSSGDYHLCLNSYCLPSGNPWSLHIGHQAQGCGTCTSPVDELSWGVLKARYQ